MTRAAFSMFGLLLLAALPAAAEGSPDPAGVWMRGDGNARVRIAACGDKICATNLWIGDTSEGEEAGDQLIMTLTPKSSNTLAGTAYDVKRKRSYSMTMKVSKSSLVTRGCILGGVLCKSVNWTAAK